MKRVNTGFVGQVSAASSPAIAKLKGRTRATNDPAYVPLASSHRAQPCRRRDPDRDLPRRTSGDSDPDATLRHAATESPLHRRLSYGVDRVDISRRRPPMSIAFCAARSRRSFPFSFRPSSRWP
jgi:hypothetical protein